MARSSEASALIGENVAEIDGDEVSPVFSNPLILGKIFEHLSNRDLLKFRKISKLFDEESVRVLVKRGYGGLVGSIQFTKVQELLVESRHPKLLFGNVFISKEDFLEEPKFREAVIANSEHIRLLRIFYYPNEEMLSILNVCSKIVELSICGDLSRDYEDHIHAEHTQWIQKMSFNFKNLTRLGFYIKKYGLNKSQRDLTNYTFKEIVKASEKLIVIECQSWQLPSVLKFFEEDNGLAIKMTALKTFGVSEYKTLFSYADEDEDKDEDEVLVEEKIALLKLLTLIGNSIENLYLRYSNWDGFSTSAWPTMPNLTTLSCGDGVFGLEMPSIENLPSKIQRPKLNLLLLGHSDDSLEKAMDSKGYWKFELDPEMESFKDGQPSRRENSGTLTAVVWAYGGESDFRNIEGDTIQLLENLEVNALFLNMRCMYDVISKHFFLVTLFFGFPSLTRLSVRNEIGGPDRDVEFRTAYFKQ